MDARNSFGAQYKGVFAYFHYYVVGASTEEEAQKKLHKDLLKGIDDTPNMTSHNKKFFKDLMEELYVTEAFCSGSYSNYLLARDMQFPWKRPKSK